ncbi:hypothetical protein ANO11243_052400 [Dothideomycetidae sp. 11243]|nr:hypothetical protein ANO11243_052400 [fungal sp. No.11243]
MARSPASILLAPTAWIGIAILGAFVAFWSGAVNATVPDPYLDEVFHVRQAQKYIDGKYLEWDPKITTPPGLQSYALSTVLSWATGLSSTASLRAINAFLLPCLILIVLHMESKLKKTETALDVSSDNDAEVDQHPHATHQIHVAFNIALFPPLFFFSALYYTDIAAVISVLLCWNHFLHCHDGGYPSVVQDLTTVLLGLFSLTFRQTNIFWVFIFPAAILLISRIDVGLDDPEGKEEILADPPVREAYADGTDYLFFIMSIVQRLCRVAQLSLSGRYAYSKLIRLLTPYAVILASFAAFVVWNGGVVLGDKSNHIATIHLPQMLYIWPYILFFSYPLCYPYLAQGTFHLLSSLTVLAPLEANLMFKRKQVLPRIVLLVGFAGIAGIVIYYNTIVHPFTLADNRHYMFYIFRLLTRYRITKFLVIPIYLIGAWAIIQALGAPAQLRLHSADKNLSPDQNSQLSSSSSAKDKSDPASATPLRLNLAVAREGAPVSFVLIWLVTATLNLVTAPLVEPRYFIIPWIMWRLRVPRAGEADTAKVVARKGDKSWSAIVSRAWVQHDRRLWVESAWFLLVNAVTGYIFLYRGFEWAQERERVQRFMW